MICAEDEIGVGTDHAGIMVLPENTPVGIPATADYFNVYRTRLSKSILPRTVEPEPHIGVARDLAAYLQQTQDIHYTLPPWKLSNRTARMLKCRTSRTRPEACRRRGICIEGVTVTFEWLQNRMAIGLHPINNIGRDQPFFSAWTTFALFR